jgi:hypothetical protein
MAARCYSWLFREGLTRLCFPTNEGATSASGVKRQMVQNHDVLHFAYFSCKSAEKGEPTSGLEPLTCSLRMISHALQGSARDCKSRISKGFFLLCFAACCPILRSRWYQSGINIALPSARKDGGLKNRKFGLSRLCHLRKRVNIEEKARVPQNPRIRRSVKTSD